MPPSLSQLTISPAWTSPPSAPNLRNALALAAAHLLDLVDVLDRSAMPPTCAAGAMHDGGGATARWRCTTVRHAGTRNGERALKAAADAGADAARRPLERLQQLAAGYERTNKSHSQRSTTVCEPGRPTSARSPQVTWEPERGQGLPSDSQHMSPSPLASYSLVSFCPGDPCATWSSLPVRAHVTPKLLSDLPLRQISQHPLGPGALPTSTTVIISHRDLDVLPCQSSRCWFPSSSTRHWTATSPRVRPTPVLIHLGCSRAASTCSFIQNLAPHRGMGYTRLVVPLNTAPSLSKQ
jgi:hypothetical protein